MRDFKIAYIKIRGSEMTEVKIRIYEGSITTKNEENPITREIKPITRYRRTNLVAEKIYNQNQLKDLKSLDDLNSFISKDNGITNPTTPTTERVI